MPACLLVCLSLVSVFLSAGCVSVRWTAYLCYVTSTWLTYKAWRLSNFFFYPSNHSTWCSHCCSLIIAPRCPCEVVCFFTARLTVTGLLNNPGSRARPVHMCPFGNIKIIDSLQRQQGLLSWRHTTWALLMKAWSQERCNSYIAVEALLDMFNPSSDDRVEKEISSSSLSSFKPDSLFRSSKIVHRSTRVAATDSDRSKPCVISLVDVAVE